MTRRYSVLNEFKVVKKQKSGVSIDVSLLHFNSESFEDVVILYLSE